MPTGRFTATDIQTRLVEQIREAQNQQLREMEAGLVSTQSVSAIFPQRPLRWATQTIGITSTDFQQYYVTDAGSIDSRSDGEPKLTQLMKRRGIEKQDVERFITTGACTQEMYVDGSGKLMVTGYHMGDTQVLFIMDAETIIAQKKRTRHLKPLLNKLAKREGLELQLTDAPPEPLAGARRITYFVFKNREEVDDTALVSVTQPTFHPMGASEIEPEYEGGLVNLANIPF